MTSPKRVSVRAVSAAARLGLALLAGAALILVQAGCRSDSLLSVSPTHLPSELRLRAEQRALEDAVAADGFPDANEEGL